MLKIKSSKIFFPFSVFAFLFLLTSCVNIKEVQCTGIAGFKLNKINTEGINADVKVKIKNPNSFSFKVYKSEVDIVYGGINIGKARLLKTIKVKAGSENEYSCRLDGDFKHLKLDDIIKLLESITRKGTMEVRGKVKVGRFFVRKEIQVNIKDKVQVEG